MDRKETIGYGLIILAVVLGTTLIMMKVGFDQQAVILCDAIDQDPEKEMHECPAHTSSIPWLLMIAFGVTLTIFAAGAWLAIGKRAAQGLPVRLDDEERRVRDIIKEREGSTYQSDLIKETEWSKVKMTRVLDRLEQKKVVERKRRGMTNLVVLR